MARALYRLREHEADSVCISNHQVQLLIALVVLVFTVPGMHAHHADCAVGRSHLLDVFHQCRLEAWHSSRRVDLHFENSYRSRNSKLNLRPFDTNQHDTLPSTLRAQGPRSGRHFDDYDLSSRRHSHIRRSQLLERNSSRSRQEMHDLISFKASISRDPLKTLGGWSVNASTPCNWEGISCSSDGRHVVAVDLHGCQLVGNIGSALQALSRLQSLERVNLAANSFTGSLPRSAFGNWSGLLYLNVSMNYIVGKLPAQVGELINLQTLDLQYNNLTGEIPTSICNNTALKTLDLGTNRLSGKIPGEIGRLSSLELLNLGTVLPDMLPGYRPEANGNLFSGMIPPSLGNCTLLKTLSVQNNPHLGGEIPVNLDQLTGLQMLNLSFCSFGGDFQEWIGNLTNLRVITLRYNLFNGHIPTTLGNLRELNYLALSENNISGIIPPSILNCTSLGYLLLQSNALLTGDIPSNIGRLSKLRRFLLWETSVTGVLPASFSNCSAMQYIGVTDNELMDSQPMPAWLGSLANLSILFLNNIKMSGPIPKEIGRLVNLQMLSFYFNSLTGSVPPELGNCTSLWLIQIGGNLLTGHLPPEIGNLPELEQLSLWYTYMSGPLPASLSNMTKIMMFYVSFCNFSGAIDTYWGSLPQLTMLYLGSNQFSGSIPASLGNSTTLDTVDLSANRLTGEIPSTLGNMTALSDLALAENQIGGTIPPELARVSNLVTLDLSFNNLEGTIPSNIGALFALQNIYLGTNKLSGVIPESLINCTGMLVLDLSQNRLTGEISPSLGNMTALSELVLAENRIGGTIPPKLVSATSLLTLDLRINSLEGNIPSNIGHLVALEKLYLGGNKLSGIVPKSLIGCSALRALDLSNNQLNGSIPLDIMSQINLLTSLNLSNNRFSGPFMPSVSGEAKGDARTLPSNDSGWKLLVKLDISGNDFSGVIPESLGLLQRLTFFNASYNNFQGPIPDTGVFLSLTAASFLGNPLLCGAILGHDQECQDSSAGLSRSCKGFRCKRVWIPTMCSDIFLAVLLGLAVWFLARAALRKRSKEKKEQQDFTLTFDLVMKFSTDDVLQVVHQNHIIAKGPINVVYKGVLSGGKTFAVKVLSQRHYQNAEGGQGNSISKQSNVLHEVRIMANLRHRNILRVVGYCAHAGMKAIILEYMPRGSLWHHLHGLGDGNCRLPWQRRLNIALGVAEGMKYLHDDFPEPLIHGDLKPSNILLDSAFLPKVADFGLSKFVSPHREDQATASAICGTVGYIPPEYALEPVVSTKGDVYSYGIVLLELLSGRSPTSESSANFYPSTDYRSWAVANYQQNPISLVDSALKDESLADQKVNEQTRLTLLLALLCTREMPQSRPTMCDALRMLVDVNEIELKAVERRSIRELAHEPPDRRYNPFSTWSEEDPNGTTSPSLSLQSSHQDEAN